MSILGNDINKGYIPFNGDYHPVSIYEGEHVIFEPKKIENGTEDNNSLIVENTYNDVIDNLKVYGNTHQDTGRTIGVKKDTVVQFDDFQGEYGIVEVKTNENLINLKTDNEYYVNDGVYEFNVSAGDDTKTATLCEIALTEGVEYTMSANIEIVGEPSGSACGLFKIYRPDWTDAIDLLYSSGTRMRTFTPKSTNTYKISIFGIGATPATTDFKVIFKNIKLELGDKATPWIPSKADQEAGVEMPSYEVTRCGRNLFDVDNFLSDKYEHGAAYGNALPYPLGKTFVASTNFVRDDGMGCWFYCNNSTSGFWLNHEKVAISVDNYVPSGRNFQIGVPHNIDGFFDNYYVQIELGTTAHSYEPYQGDTYTIQPNTPTKIPLLKGTNIFFADQDIDIEVQYLKSDTATEEDTDLQTPTPNFPEEIESVGGEIMVSGKNLFDTETFIEKATITKGVLEKFENGFKIIANQQDCYTNTYLNNGSIKVPDALMQFAIDVYGKDFCLSFDKGGTTDARIFVTYVGEDGYITEPLKSYLCYDNEHYEINVMVKQETKYVLVRFGATESGKYTTFSNIQLELGDKATPYKPYAGEPQTITIPTLNKIGDVQDILHVDRASQRMWVERKCKEIVLDGSEGWGIYYGASTKFSGVVYKKDMYTNGRKHCFSSSFAPQNTPSKSTEEGITCGASNQEMYITTNVVDNMTDFKQWLSENPTTVIYQLAEPVIEELEYNEDLLTFYPTTVINVGELETEIKATMKQFK